MAMAIHLAGPSILFAYMITGVICFFIMRALGELLLSNLNYHSFVDFVHDYLGKEAAFITGWTYWFCWISLAMADVTAVGLYDPEYTSMGSKPYSSCSFTNYESYDSKVIR